MTAKTRRTRPDEEISSPSLVDPFASPRGFRLDVQYLPDDRQSDSERDLERLRRRKRRTEQP
jgi:hypothetical protein